MDYEYNFYQTEKLRNTLNSMIADIQPTHFLSVQFPKSMRNRCLEKSSEHLRDITSKFQTLTVGHNWIKKHISFIAVAEHNKLQGWHYHIYLCAHNQTTGQLQKALDKLCKNKNLIPETFKLDPITMTPDKVYSYGTKQIAADSKGHWDSSRWITSEFLFNLPPQSHNRTRINEIESDLIPIIQTIKKRPVRKILKRIYYLLTYWMIMTDYYFYMFSHSPPTNNKLFKSNR